MQLPQQLFSDVPSKFDCLSDEAFWVFQVGAAFLFGVVHAILFVARSPPSSTLSVFLSWVYPWPLYFHVLVVIVASV